MRYLSLVTACLVLSLGAVADDAVDLFDRVNHHFADSDGVKIHYVSIGEGPTLLFIHGFPDFWYSWRNQMHGLSKDFTCVAMDTRGYNKSDKPEGIPNYDMKFLLSDVDAVINALGEENVTVVAHDWGGGIAWRYAMTRPERVNKLVICNLTHPKGYFKVRENATPEQAANMKYIERFQDPDASKMFNPKMLSMISAGSESAEVKAHYEKAFELSNVDSMLNYYRAAWKGFQGEISVEVPDLPMPVLQFHGLRDTAVDKDGLRDTWNWIKADYTLVTIPTSGHWVQREAHELVTTTMRWWLKSRP